MTNLRRDYTDILLTNWKIWPATQLANFYFVPFQHRILVIQPFVIRVNYWFLNKYGKMVSNIEDRETLAFQSRILRNFSFQPRILGDGDFSLPT